MTRPAGEEVRLAMANLMRVAEPLALASHAIADVTGVRSAAKRVRGGGRAEGRVIAPAGLEVQLARAYLMRVAEPPALALRAYVEGVRTAAEQDRGGGHVEGPVIAPAGEKVRFAKACLMWVVEPLALALHAFVNVAGARTAAERVRRANVSAAGWRVA